MAKTTKSRRGVASNAQSPKRAAVAKKPAPTKQKSSGQLAMPEVRRPAVNEPIDSEVIQYLQQTLANAARLLERSAAHLRALDRSRLNGVGIKKLGFIDKAFDLSSENPEFLPHWITVGKFQDDIETFRSLSDLIGLNQQIRELLWNFAMQAADMAYTDALEYYASIREAAKRRVDAAESIFSQLKPFFENHGRKGRDEPTEAEIKHDINALLHGRKDGEVIIKNKSPKIEKGEKKIIDRSYKTKTAYKNIDEGEII